MAGVVSGKGRYFWLSCGRRKDTLSGKYEHQRPTAVNTWAGVPQLAKNRPMWPIQELWISEIYDLSRFSILWRADGLPPIPKLFEKASMSSHEGKHPAFPTSTALCRAVCWIQFKIILGLMVLLSKAWWCLPVVQKRHGWSPFAVMF